MAAADGAHAGPRCDAREDEGGGLICHRGGTMTIGSRPGILLTGHNIKKKKSVHLAGRESEELSKGNSAGRRLSRASVQKRGVAAEDATDHSHAETTGK